MTKQTLNSPLFNALALSIIWAIKIFISKLGLLSGLEVATFTIQSYFLTFIILGSYVFIKKLPEIRKVPLNILKKLTIANIIHSGLGEFSSNMGILLTSAINAGFLLQFTTVTTTLLAWIFLKEKMTFAKAITVAAIMFGTFILITKGQLLTPHVGDLIILFSCLCWSTGNVMIKKVINHKVIEPAMISFFRPIGGLPTQLLLVAGMPLYPINLRSVFVLHAFSFHGFQYVILNGILCSILWTFLNRTYRVASASYATMMSSLTPLLIAFLAVVFLKEKLEVIQWVGVIIIISSSWITHYLKFDKH